MKLDSNNNFLYRFREIVEKFPANPAVIENNCTITTYKRLLEDSLKTAAFLKENAKGNFVGVSIEKSAKYLTAILGCWFAGKAFVPVGTSLPKNRRDYILNDAGIEFVFGEEDYDKAITCEILETADFDIEYNQPAYIIYTSGSTGRPKGVLVSHNGIVNLADCQRKAFEVDETSRYFFYLSINFDASISDICVSLLSGAALVIEAESALNIASSIMRLIYSRQITHMDIPPSLLKLLDVNKITNSLKTVVVGGEACDIETVRKWSGKVNLVNVYGPTEATVCTSLCKCTPEWSEPLLGLPINNIGYEIYQNNIPSDYGELYISGIGLATGYVNNKELTDKKFVIINGKRFYRTGDLVERRDDGEIKFLGRIDRQVKIRGQLAELEEIENLLNSHPAVYRSCVLKRPIYNGGSDNLAAFAELKNPAGESELMDYLKEFLPVWMVPARIEILDKMPLTITGKIDTAVLKNYKFKQGLCINENLTDKEKKVIEIFKKIIGLEHVGLHDNFFELGGSSLDALELIFACKRIGLSVSEKMLSKDATPEFIANYPKNSESVMMMNVSTLKEDMKFSADFEIARTLPDNKENVLITGATGFLGSALLSRLLADTDYTCYCIVRSDSVNAGLKRIEQTFESYGLNNFNSCRIRIICGDISKDNFGLNDDLYKSLSEKIFRVYHCAAAVNMLYPYEKLKNINLDGVKRILRFACGGVKKELHYASTLSVFVSTDKNVGVVYEKDKLDDIEKIWGGYGQSKFAAEKYLLNSGLDNIYIYRFGLICGDSVSGISSKNDFLGMFIKGAEELGSLPYDKSEKMAVDITPVDFAVKSVVKISESKTPERIFHIANKKPLMYNDFIKYIKESGIICEIPDYDIWSSAVEAKASSLNEEACITSLCRMDPSKFELYRFMDLFQATEIVFDTKNAFAVSKLECPCADEKLIKKYLSMRGEKCLQV